MLAMRRPPPELSPCRVASSSAMVSANGAHIGRAAQLAAAVDDASPEGAWAVASATIAGADAFAACASTGWRVKGLVTAGMKIPFYFWQAAWTLSMAVWV